MKKDYFGINISAYCREHEHYLETQSAAGADRHKLLNRHLQKLTWLQHERLIHLLVTLMAGLAFVAALAFGCYGGWDLGTFLLAAILLVLLTAYLWHYFQLENTVQHWYRLADQLQAQLDQQDSQQSL